MPNDNIFMTPPRRTVPVATPGAPARPAAARAPVQAVDAEQAARRARLARRLFAEAPAGGEAATGGIILALYQRINGPQDQGAPGLPPAGDGPGFGMGA